MRGLGQVLRERVVEVELALVAKLQDLLPLDDAMLAHDRRVANSRQGVPTAAIETAVEILDELGPMLWNEERVILDAMTRRYERRKD